MNKIIYQYRHHYLENIFFLCIFLLPRPSARKGLKAPSNSVNLTRIALVIQSANDREAKLIDGAICCFRTSDGNDYSINFITLLLNLQQKRQSLNTIILHFPLETCHF